MRTLLCIQFIVLALATGWGAARGLPWWQHLHLDAGLLPATVAGAALSLSTWRLFPQAYRALLQSLFAGHPYRALLGLALLSGLAEEALFRGVLLQETGLVVSSSIFGLLHAGDRRFWTATLWSLAVGLVLGLLYRATGNLAHCVALHASCNAVSFRLLAVVAPPHLVQTVRHLGRVGAEPQ